MQQKPLIYHGRCLDLQVGIWSITQFLAAVTAAVLSALYVFSCQHLEDTIWPRFLLLLVVLAPAIGALHD